jgi:DNA-3-methyladenine glycosylase I
MQMNGAIKRCDWASGDSAYIKYHDTEWGVPVHDDRKIFEFLILEGAQAGLSWLTVLRKRENYRKVFDMFNPEKVASYGKDKVLSILSDKGIIRNRLKVEAAVSNAQAFLRVKEEFGSFDSYIWGFVGHKTIRNNWEDTSQIPSRSIESEKMSMDMRRRGFKFVGSTICYAHMQATGMVNDHITSCFRYTQL